MHAVSNSMRGHFGAAAQLSSTLGRRRLEVHVKRMFQKPSVFIGSALESLDVAKAIQRQLSHTTHADVWTDTDFFLTHSTLSSLIRAAETYDFAVFVLTPDDVTYIRDRQSKTARGNVIFELGMFLGTLNAGRTFFVVPRATETTELPSDLLGITPASYDQGHFNKNATAALGDACGIIQVAIEREGICASHHFLTVGGESVKTVVAGETLANSPVGLDGLLYFAKTEVFLAAQDHYYVLVRYPDRFKALLFDFLRANGARRVRFLICQLKDPYVETWGTLFGNSSSYREDLEKAFSLLALWVKEAADDGLRLEAKCAPLVPLSVNFIDPLEEEALAVLTPNVFEHLSVRRPWYLLSKREHFSIFQSYWSAYENAFERGDDVLERT